MAGTSCSPIAATALTSNGTANGAVAIASVTGWKVGARVALSDSTTTVPVLGKIVGIITSTNTLLIKQLDTPSWGWTQEGPIGSENVGLPPGLRNSSLNPTDMSAWLTANTAKVAQLSTFIYSPYAVKATGATIPVVTVSPASATISTTATQAYTATVVGSGAGTITWFDGGAGGSFSPTTGASTTYTPPTSPATITITAFPASGTSGTATLTTTLPAPSHNYLATRNSPTYTAPGAAFSNSGSGPGPTWTGGGFTDPNSGTLASQIAWTQQAGGATSGNMLYSGTLDSAYALVNATQYVFSVRVKSSTAFSFFVFIGASVYTTTFPTANTHGQVELSHPGDGQWHTLGFVFTAGTGDQSAGNFNMGSMYSNASASILIPTCNTDWFDWEFGPT